MRSVRPGGKYRSIRHRKISEIQTGIFGRMERAPGLRPHVQFVPSRSNPGEMCTMLTYVRIALATTDVQSI